MELPIRFFVPRDKADACIALRREIDKLAGKSGFESKDREKGEVGNYALNAAFDRKMDWNVYQDRVRRPVTRGRDAGSIEAKTSVHPNLAVAMFQLETYTKDQVIAALQLTELEDGTMVDFGGWVHAGILQTKKPSDRLPFPGVLMEKRYLNPWQNLPYWLINA